MRFVYFFFLIVFFLGGNAVPAGAMAESDLLSVSESVLVPYLGEHFSLGALHTPDGIEIRYAKSEAVKGRGALVVVDGRTEFMSKYSELFYDLRDSGLSLFIYDHRGQGESSRLLADREKGHVGHFDDYVEDLHRFLETVVKAANPGPIVLLSHSMGATIAVLHEQKYPGMVVGMILSSPMFAVSTAPFPVPVAKILCRVSTFFGFGDRYVIGGEPYNHHLKFEHNDLTESPARFRLNRSWVERNPAFAVGSPTFGWLDEAFSAMGRIRGDAVGKLPLLVLTGEEDVVVGKKVQKAYCEARPNCAFVLLPHGKHELLMEKDPVRNDVLLRIRGFLDRLMPES